MNILEEIIAYKKFEVDKTKSILSLEEVKKKANIKERKKRDFFQRQKDKFLKKEIGLIAEVKKASPSKGIIRQNFNPVEIAVAYESGGATCLSVLTDEKYFQGDGRYIGQIKNSVNLPVLRKDFIVDPYQIFESINMGADCVLLIVSALEKELFCDLMDLTFQNGLDILVEVHDERETEVALNAFSKMNSSGLLGINNRNLKTFETKLEVTINLVKKYKRDLLDKVVVSESGISNNGDIKTLMLEGVYNFLVGESLMRESDISKATELLLG